MNQQLELCNIINVFKHFMLHHLQSVQTGLESAGRKPEYGNQIVSAVNETCGIIQHVTSDRFHPSEGHLFTFTFHSLVVGNFRDFCCEILEHINKSNNSFSNRSCCNFTE